MRAITPQRTSAEPMRKRPGTNRRPPPNPNSATEKPAAPPTATSHRGSQVEGSSTNRPTTAYGASASPGWSSWCATPSGSRTARRRRSTTRGLAPRRSAEAKIKAKLIPNSSENSGKKRCWTNSCSHPDGSASVGSS